jgi:hypothetical protein
MMRPLKELALVSFPETAPSEGAGLYQEFTASFSALPALKDGTLAAAIWIGAPVCGLRPVRAGRSLTLNEPNPTSDTELPDFSDAAIASVMASIARAAAAFGKSAVTATASINSDLFTISPSYACRFKLMWNFVTTNSVNITEKVTTK